MAVDNQLLAIDCANKFARSCNLPVSELEMAALMGLLKACRLYDPFKINPRTGTPFKLSSIAVPYIRGAMKHHVRDKTFGVKFPHKWRELGPKVRRLSDSGLSAEEIAAQIVAAGSRITPDEVLEIISCMKTTKELTERDEPVSSNDPEALAVAEQDATGWEYFNHCLELAQQACKGLSAADADMIGQWVAVDARRAVYPSGPLQQFNAHLRIELRSRAGHLLR